MNPISPNPLKRADSASMESLDSASSRKIEKRESEASMESIDTGHLEMMEDDVCARKTQDGYFVKNNDQVSQVLAGLVCQSPENERVIYVQTPADLEEAGLLRQASINAQGEVKHQQGLLYNHTPVTLVIDFRQMTPAMIADFNELFENPRRCGRQPISPEVRIVSLVSEEMLPRSRDDKNKPASDFWRRVSAPENQWTVATEQPGLEELMQKFSPPEELGPDVLSVDLSAEPDWRRVLFGGIAMKELRPVYQQGVIEGMRDGQVLNLVNAPWYDLAFQLAITELLEGKALTSNGQPFKVPKGLTLSREVREESSWGDLLQGVRWQTDPLPDSGSYAVINASNIDSILSEVCINQQGQLEKNSILEGMASTCDCLRVTEALSQGQWQKLLARLKKLPEPGLSLCIDNPTSQPEKLNCPETASLPLSDSLFAFVDTDTSALSTFIAKNFEDTKECSLAALVGDMPLDVKIMTQQPPVVIDVTPDLSLYQLTGRTDIASFRQMDFRQHTGPLLKALKNGQTVVFRGLESNPKLMLELEGLLGNPLGLVANGQYHTFDKARVIVVWPNKGVAASEPWQRQLKSGADRAGLYYFLTYLSETSFDQSLEVLGGSRTVSRDERNFLKQVRHLLEDLSALPVSSRKEWPYEPPELTAALMDKLLDQVQTEIQLLGGDASQRKAVNTLISKHYRGHPEVYSQVKAMIRSRFPDAHDKEQWVDTRALRKFLKKYPAPDRKLVQQHFWSLARNISPAFNIQTLCNMDEDLDQVCQLLLQVNVQVNGGQNQETMAKFLEVDYEEHDFQDRDLELESALRDAFLSDRQNVPESFQVDIPGLAASWQALEREEDKYRLLCSQRLSPMAAACFNQHRLRREVNWSARKNRRVIRLREKLLNSPLVFFKGEAGTGKSYMATIVSQDRNPTVMTVGPATTQDDLFYRQSAVVKPLVVTAERLQGFSPDFIRQMQVWGQTNGEGQHTVEANEETRRHFEKLNLQEEYFKYLAQYSDKASSLIEGPLMRWVKKQPGVDSPQPTLIIDEANLAQPGMWECLKGLLDSKKPHICINGQYHKVSPGHRVIFTGNPESFPGRVRHDVLDRDATTLFYQPMEPEMLRHEVIMPALQKVFSLNRSGSNDSEGRQALLETCAEQMLAMMGHYQRCLGEHEFTPRDYLDICARLQVYLRTTGTDLSLKALGSLVWQAFQDSFAGETSHNYPHLQEAMYNWFSCHYDMDDTVLETYKNQFSTFYLEMQRREGQRGGAQRFDFGGASIHALSERIWCDLRKSLLERETGQSHWGRHATLIEGPAGRGKDALLGHCLEQWKKDVKNKTGAMPEVIAINAGKHNWDSLKQAIIDARTQGHILVISEINLIASQYLEGELNDVLTGNAAPGFHLFATMNPPEYAGREVFSKALKSRFCCNRIGDYDHAELMGIAMKQLDNNFQKASTLVQWHWDLRQALENQGISLQPTASNLVKLCDYCRSMDSESLQAGFDRCYRVFNKLKDKYVRCWEDEEEEQSQPMEITRQAVSSEQLLQLVRDLFQTFPELPPTSVQIGESNQYFPESGLLLLKADSPERLRVNAIDTILSSQWHDAGMPGQAETQQDILQSALLQLWQQKRARQYCGKDDAVALYPLSVVQRKTLALPENARIVANVESLLSAHNFEPGLYQLAQFNQLLFSRPPERQRSYGSSRTALRETSRPPERQRSYVSTREVIEPAPNPEKSNVSLLEVGPAIMLEVGPAITLEIQPVVSKTPENIFNGQSISITEKILEKEDVQVVFDRVPLRQTRFVLHELDCVDNQLIVKEPEPGRWGYDVTLPEDLGEHRQASGEALGKTEIIVYAQQWVALPDLFAGGCLSSIMSTPEAQLDVVRDRYTGRYLLRLADKEQMPASSIKLQVSYTMSLKTMARVSDPRIIPSVPECPDWVRQAVDEQVYQRLRDRSREGQIEIIRALVHREGKPAEITPLQGTQLMRYLTTANPAYDGHRAYVAWTLLTRLGIPARVALMGMAKKQCEYSLDNGMTWQVMGIDPHKELPGTQFNEIKAEWPEVKQLSVVPLPSHLNLMSTPDPVQIYETVSSVLPGGTWEFRNLIKDFPMAVGLSLSLDGAFSLDKLKPVLERYGRSGCFDKDEFESLLLGLLYVVGVRAERKAELKPLYFKLVDFVQNEKGWLGYQHYHSAIHQMCQHSRYRGRAENARRNFYEQLLTRPLVRGKDYRLPSATADRDFSFLNSFAARGRSKTLEASLYGLVHGKGYHELPPGTIEPGRLAAGQNAFVRAQLQPRLLPVYLVCDGGKYLDFAVSRALRAYKTGQEEDDDVKDSVPLSLVLAKALAMPAQLAFGQYFYDRVAGRGDNIKLVFPYEQVAEPDSFDDRDKSWLPRVQGYVVPANCEELTALAVTMPYKAVIAQKESNIQGRELQDAFGDGQACVIGSKELGDFYWEFLESLPWQEIFQQVVRSEGFLRAVPGILKARHNRYDRIDKSSKVSCDIEGLEEVAEKLTGLLYTATSS